MLGSKLITRDCRSQFADNQHEVGALGVRSERSAVQGAKNFRRSCVSYHILRAATEQKIAPELGKPVWEAQRLYVGESHGSDSD